MNLKSRQSPAFPPVEQALDDPNGLLAVGGALNADWLTMAYRRGIFPWFDSDDGPILWWCPDPRAVIWPDKVRISRSLVKRLRNGGFKVTADTAFTDVIDGCAAARVRPSAEHVELRRAEHPEPTPQSAGTWITTGMRQAYVELHELGIAHSIEVWRQSTGRAEELVGGLYGISLGRMFFGESMFSRTRDASKIALCHLARQLESWDFWLIDCQIANPHLTSMGAVDIARDRFIELVEKNAHQPTRQGPWTLDHIPAQNWQRQSAL